ncbi:Protein FIZZY-RELATED 2 [Phytophthora fragariae]|uniref:Protein FIZZY-RELATED 2 n=1 Tax=Phytophthora fragariae TaxID=53985 RepID=A0A6A3FED5_9STRA|nr:Protein FIZZY-RELATED 2 [Phytophthora fragariae]KAE8943979.1 Protein FIZZY-RELATED 2 [Phytophthora fragariae]KAE9021626.1 Protein FIZZY-RELATED 2 [Phytophthora fragariae]KAE9109572.1 Protein FIZZY-RELATED 2 [Phytophthora fragariae]KAE9126949.1 Protein FIZZY-RELATED 2 [Phytophthora fragariae]
MVCIDRNASHFVISPSGGSAKGFEPLASLRVNSTCITSGRKRRLSGSSPSNAMGRDSFALPGTSAQPLHRQYESRLTGLSDENGSNYGKVLPHRTAKRSKHIYSDRFIPSRLTTKLDTGFGLVADSPRQNSNQNRDNGVSRPQGGAAPASAPASGTGSSVDSNPKTQGASVGTSSPYSMMLKRELLGMHSPTRTNFGGSQPASALSASSHDSMSAMFDPRSTSCVRTYNDSTACIRPSGSSSSNILRFKAPRQSLYGDVKTFVPHSGLTDSTQRFLGAGLHDGDNGRRRIARTPFKVLDAPSLQDDFYLNLVDWSATNVVAVGLSSCVYLWSACTSKVTMLCDLGPSDSVTSVSWSQRGTHLSVGTNSGEVQIWDVSASKKIRTMTGHLARVGTLGWNGQSLASGSRDRTILVRDLRTQEPFQNKLAGHKQEVCGLKWSFDGRQLASGGNDNKLLIWNVQSMSSGLRSDATMPLARFNEHSAAVKAIAWSPHQHGLLASGGGTADRCIRFWNTQSLTALPFVDTGSQVCNLMWSKNANEVVSTHGYSLNQIIVWKYPTMTKLATLTGHTFRVLYLAMSPDGQTIVTGAGDETLRFWNAFPSTKAQRGSRLGTDLMLPLSVGSEIR